MPRTREIVYGARTLSEFLSENMYNSEFENPENSGLGWTKTSLTRACNSPESISLKKIEQLSVFLFGNTQKVGMLVEKFRAGKNTITIDEMEEITNRNHSSESSVVSS